MKKKILMSLLVSGLIVGLATPSILKANESEEKELEEIVEEVENEQEVKETKLNSEETSVSTLSAPVDWAFTEASRPLEEGILSVYNGANYTYKVDANDDGYISKTEAAAFNGSRLFVRNLGLTGTIDGIEYFTHSNLSWIDLSNNNFTGNIPAGIGNMSITTLELKNNQLSGELPKELGDITTLLSLQLGGNKFSGELPKELFSLPNLETLALPNNQISGEIPVEIGSMPKLKNLNLGYNNLSGSIPKELGNLPNFTGGLALCGNNLTGTIPKELGNLNLTDLVLYDNNLSGEVPKEIANSTNMLYLRLANNNLSGEIPAEFGNMPKLKQFDVSNNKGLTGTTEVTFETTPQLQLLAVNGTSMNQIKPTNVSLIVFFYDIFDDNGKIRDGVTVEALEELLSDLEDFKVAFPTDYSEGSMDKWIIDTVHPLVNAIDEAKQIFEDSKSAVNDLFNPDGTLKDEIIQDDINDAEDLVNKLPAGDLKDELKDKLEDAQNQLNEREAEKAVDNLFDEDGKIKDTVTQEDIDNAQDLVNKVTDEDKKKELQDKLDEAQKQLEEKEFVVVKGFATFTGEGTVSATIDAPVEKFSKVYVDGKLLPASNYVVTSGSTVITLNENYLKALANKTYNVEIEFTSGAKVSVPLTIDVKTITDPTNPVDPTKPVEPTDPSHPSVDVSTVSKPSVNPSTSSSTNGSNVNTGDTTDMMMLYGMLAVSILGIVVIGKRRKAVK